MIAPAGAALPSVLAAARPPPARPAASPRSRSRTASRRDQRGLPENEDQAWLLRLDRGAEAVAGEQPVGFGDVVSLRLGESPAPVRARPGAGAGATGAPGSAGTPGAPGKIGETGAGGPQGERGPRGRPGRNAELSCKRQRRAGKKQVQCTVKGERRGKSTRR